MGRKIRWGRLFRRAAALFLATLAVWVLPLCTGAGATDALRDLGEDPDFDTVVSHLEHFLALGGENNVYMGGDWDGITRMPRGMSGIQDMEKLYEHLLRRNYSESLLEKVFYSNLMRVVNEVCSM